MLLPVHWIGRTKQVIAGDYVPTIADDTVYVTVSPNENEIIALNAATGTVERSYPLEGNLFYSPTVANGVMYIAYVAKSSSGVEALDVATGAQLWEYPIRTFNDPAVVNGMVFVESVDGNVYALNAATGALVWTNNIGNIINNDGPAVANGLVYVDNDVNGAIHALNATTGALVWTYNFGDRSMSDPAVANGVVYVGDFNSNLYALNATTGALFWIYPGGANGVAEGSPIISNGEVFSIGSGTLYALYTNPPPIPTVTSVSPNYGPPDWRQ